MDACMHLVNPVNRPKKKKKKTRKGCQVCPRMLACISRTLSSVPNKRSMSEVLESMAGCGPPLFMDEGLYLYAGDFALVMYESLTEDDRGDSL